MQTKKWNKNEYYPLSRLGKDVTVAFTPSDTVIEYELYDEWKVISVICNQKYEILEVRKGKDYKERNEKLYLSLRRFTWRIARVNHFTYEE